MITLKFNKTKNIKQRSIVWGVRCCKICSSIRPQFHVCLLSGRSSLPILRSGTDKTFPIPSCLRPHHYILDSANRLYLDNTKIFQICTTAYIKSSTKILTVFFRFGIVVHSFANETERLPQFFAAKLLPFVHFVIGWGIHDHQIHATEHNENFVHLKIHDLL